MNSTKSITKNHPKWPKKITHEWPSKQEKKIISNNNWNTLKWHHKRTRKYHLNSTTNDPQNRIKNHLKLQLKHLKIAPQNNPKTPPKWHQTITWKHHLDVTTNDPQNPPPVTTNKAAACTIFRHITLFSRPSSAYYFKPFSLTKIPSKKTILNWSLESS